VQADLGLDPAELEKLGSLESAGQVGVVVQRKQHMLQGGSAAELADRLIDALIEENVLKGAL
jgi:hypothetical protein